jgi:cell division protein FtsN
LSKPYLQVGIFSVEANAERAAAQMRSAGMVPTVRRGETGGKPFWRVIVGPASTSSERRALLDKIKGEGFTDAYPVSN